MLKGLVKKNVNTEVLSKPTFDKGLNSCLIKRKGIKLGVFRKRKKKVKKKKMKLLDFD